MRRLATLACLFLVATGSAVAKDCSPADEEAADMATDYLTNWQAVRDSYARYRQCDDGSIAEGNSEAVVRLLVDKWNTIPELVALTKQNADFESWVLKHIDTTVNGEDLESIERNAKENCGDNRKKICSKISSAASQALQELTAPAP